jgi:hypothetical protein
MPAKWTFMVYMAGYNNLSPFAAADLQEMRNVGSTGDVKVAVFVKRLEQQSAHHVLVGRSGQGETSLPLGNIDSGNPQTLLDFIRWAVRTAPAERYALVVWNHGSGWEPGEIDQLYAQVRADRGIDDEHAAGVREISLRAAQEIGRSLFKPSIAEVLALPSVEDRAIASDDGSGHSLDTIELNGVLERAHAHVLDEPLELLGMDACLMSNLEVAYEAEKHVLNVVASEELEPGDGWPYTAILSDLTEQPEMTGAQLGEVVVKRYVESYRNRRDQWPITQCAVSAKGIGPFVDALDTLAQAMRSHMKESGYQKIQRAQQRSTYFTGELIDLRTFCRELCSGITSGPVFDAAGSIAEQLKPNGYVLQEGHLGPTVEGVGGVTAYFPVPVPRGSNMGISPFYKDLRFAQKGWDEFLRSYAKALRGE